MPSSTSVRAVSLVPSITESLRSWGHDPVACTQYCEQPDLFHVGGTKNPDINAIVDLAPDVVLLDKVENRREDAEALVAAGLHVVAIDVRILQDVDAEMAVIAAAVDLPPPTPIRIPPVPANRFTAFVPIWRRPWMTIGGLTYGSTLLAAIGVNTVFGDVGSDYPEVTLADVVREHPDRILVPSEPYEFKPRHLVELEEIAPVVEVDGRDLFWWGARTSVAIVRLSEQLAGIEGDHSSTR